MKYFRCDAQGDTIFIKAESLEGAKLQLAEKMGPIPENLLKWTELKKLPKGQEVI